jgi:hypothetical protein
MNHRTLGILALIGAPFLLVDTLNNGLTINHTTPISGFLNLLYITGWMCSIVALRRMGAFGEGQFGKILFVVQLIFLSLANCWNLYEWIQPGAGTRLYFFLDTFWPLSNLCMLVTGITIAVKGVLKGWRRYVPLAVGCWLPLGAILWAIFTRNAGMLLTCGIYSALAWSLLAISIITAPGSNGGEQRSAERSPSNSRFALQETAV